MDPIFEAHFPIIKDAFAQRGVKIDVAYTADGDVEGAHDPQAGQTGRVVDYVYREGYLLTLNDPGNIQKLQRALPGIDPIGTPRPGRLTVLSIAGAKGYPSVRQALDIIDRENPRDAAAARAGTAPPLVTPDHVVEPAKLCSEAGEPEVPTGNAPKPWPEPRRARCRWWRPWLRRCGKRTPKAIIPDVGLLVGSATSHVWLKGVEGDPDELVQRPGQPPLIEFFNGHGTVAAGVLRCMAPDADVFVANLLPASGAELESNIAEKLNLLADSQRPEMISLSAGSYNRNHWISLSFEDFHRQHPGIPLIAAAGNDSTDQPFHPAAEPWAISVGALGADEQHLAWFSNYGPTVDVYALGEGIVNAYATGEYVYILPPKQGAIQTFSGMARWSGTSFSAPLVAGLIADEMVRTGSTVDMAVQAVLGRAQDLDGVGRVLRTS